MHFGMSYIISIHDRFVHHRISLVPLFRQYDNSIEVVEPISCFSSNQYIPNYTRIRKQNKILFKKKKHLTDIFELIWSFVYTELSFACYTATAFLLLTFSQNIWSFFVSQKMLVFASALVSGFSFSLLPDWLALALLAHTSFHTSNRFEIHSFRFIFGIFRFLCHSCKYTLYSPEPYVGFDSELLLTVFSRKLKNVSKRSPRKSYAGQTQKHALSHTHTRTEMQIRKMFRLTI